MNVKRHRHNVKTTFGLHGVRFEVCECSPVQVALRITITGVPKGEWVIYSRKTKIDLRKAMNKSFKEEVF